MLSPMDPCDMLLDEERSSQRKANKPLMEKRRRARINKSLMELKTILVESMKKSTPGHSKWEKADILEMTVQYLQCLKNQQQATKSDPLSVGQFIAGFSECIRQIQKFNVVESDHSPPIEQDLQEKLTDFLLSYLKNFSDDATQALSRSNNCHSPGTRIKGSNGLSIRSSTSPPPQHSPTSSSLSPKSPGLSPGASSSGASSPRKSDGFAPNQNTYLTLLMPPNGTQGTNTANTLLQRLQIPPVNLIDSGNNVYSLPNDSNVKSSRVWRPW